MAQSVKFAVLAAAERILEALVPFLLEGGITAAEMHMLAKRAYVRVLCEQDEAAGEDERGRISRIAVKSGLTRAIVRELLNADREELPLVPAHASRAERVIHAWVTEPDFHDKRDRPAILPLRGKPHSFSDLVKRFSGEPRVDTILKDLQRVEAVRLHPDERVELLRATYAATSWEPEAIAQAAEELSEHAATILHNLRDPTQKHFSRHLVNPHLAERFARMLHRRFALQADSLLDTFAVALADPVRTVKASRDRRKEARSLSVTLYLSERPTVVAPARDTKRARRRKS